MVCESNIGLCPSKLRTHYTNSTKLECMPPEVCNIHVGNLVHGLLDYAIECGHVIGCYGAFNVKY